MRTPPLAVLVLAIAFAGCDREHKVKILLGPDFESLSLGFRCVQDADPTKPLMSLARVGTEIRFNLVVDVMTFGGRYPGCRGEELLAACEKGPCEIPARSNAKRFCLPFAFPASLNADALYALLRDQVRGQIVTANALDGPVQLRAVATTQPCAEIDDALPDDTYPVLDPAAAVGCAYSCPVQLDDVDGKISLSFDALTTRCETAVRWCAAAPARL